MAGDDDTAAPAAGLRARARQLLRDRPAALGLGDELSQAYFNAKRFRSTRRKVSGSKKTATKAAAAKPTASRAREEEGEGSGDEHGEEEEKEEEEEEEEEEEALVLPPQGDMVAALQRVDADEAAYRDTVDGQGFPRFNQSFAQWKSELRAGYSLLLSGVGSKLALLQEFAAEALTDGYVVQVHGYLPSVSMRHLCSYLRHDVLHLKRDARNRSLLHQCQDIVRLTTRSSAYPRPLSASVAYLVVHAIDGAALRTPELQSCLSWLASSPRIYLVASLEHINGCALWKETDALRFRWLAHSVHSRRAYAGELELRLATRARAGDLAASSGVKFILQSLTPTDVGTLQELARQQLAGGSGAGAKAGDGQQKRKKKRARATTGTGTACAVPYQAVLDACRKKLLHTTVQSMKNSVKCLEDHGLLRLVRLQDAELLEIPLGEDVIRTEVLQLARDKGEAR